MSIYYLVGTVLAIGNKIWSKMDIVPSFLKVPFQEGR